MAFIEIKIPKEVRDYHENIFFGLNTRQFICSVLAVGVAVGIYFALQPYVGTEEIGWMCILGAAPFAACGFFTYHGMTAEQVLWAWFKSEILCPKRLMFKSDSYYYEAMQPAIRAGMKRKRGLPMPLGMLVTLDAIYNRVIQNWKKGRRTWIFCDEFYILFRYEYSANFFYKLWKRIRKYNGLVTGLTQNVDELLRSDTARLMLANSEFLVMLNQSATDREELAKLLNISDNQLGYVTNVPAGCGLIRCAGNIVPFTNSFPKNTKLYGLMTTKPDEVRKE